MSKRIFTEAQIKELLDNKYVNACSDKAITYSKDFKLMAIKQYCDEGIPSSRIFTAAGFDLEMIGKNIPKGCLKRWRKIVKKKGLEGLSVEQRGRDNKGGRPRTRGLTNEDKLLQLEAEVAYLKAENAFLAKLRRAMQKS